MSNLTTRTATRYISRLSSKLKREMETTAAYKDLSGAQGRVLRFILSSERTLHQKDIEDEYAIRAASATGLLNSLEEKGYITREEDPKDHRQKKIVPTEKALSSVGLEMDGLWELEKKLTAGISKENLEIVLNSLDRMMKNIED